MEIEIIRPRQYQDKIRDYNLIVDGKLITKIKPNSKTIITIDDSAKYLQAKIDWCTSPKFYIKDIKGNQIQVKNTFGGNLLRALFFPLYYITFGREKYLTIETNAQTGEPNART